MENIFSLILQWIIYLSIATTAIVVYLSINKMWSRKHEVVVADSISTSAQIISFFTILPFVINYGLKHEYGDAFYQFLWLSYTAFLILAGIGFWVREKKELNIWGKVSNSLGKEKNELGNLIKTIGGAAQGENLLDILYRLAWLDDKFDDRERQYIEKFTDILDINSDFLNEKPPEVNVDKFNRLCESVKTYLTSKPPSNEATLLGDLVQALVRVDDEISPEEEIASAEILSLIEKYVSGTTNTIFQILIHPKDADQEAQVIAVIPEPQISHSLGDRAVVACAFHTRSYAEMIGAEYRQQGWFTVVHETVD